MKHWPSLSMPLIVLGTISAVTFWLSQQALQGDLTEARAPAHRPDVIADNFVVRRYDETGRLKYRLEAPKLVHYPDTDSSEVRAPILITYRANAAPITVSADQALVTAKGETVYLTENVKIVSPSGNSRPDLIARMPDLTVETEAGLASTASPVEITQGMSQVRGIGMHIDNNAATITLDAQVRGEYIRP